MRKVVLYALVAIGIVSLGATATIYQKYQKTAAALSSAKVEAQNTQARYGEAINSISAIQDSLGAIVVGDAPPRLVSSDQAERKLNESRGDEVLDRIAVVKAGIERAKTRIQNLDANLKKSRLKVTGLDKMVANLKRSVVEKEEQITLLVARVDSLQTTVFGLATQVDDQKQTIESKRRELGTIYYCIGTKKDLTRSGIVVAKGGVLGVGKTLKPSGRFRQDRFVALDTDEQTVVHIPAAKAQVLSAQPLSSYQLELVSGRVELRILDPKQFRMIKHLVIVTT